MSIGAIAGALLEQLENADVNGDGQLTREELVAASGGDPEGGCCARCNKSKSPDETIKHFMGDWLLLGLSLMLLLAWSNARHR